MKVYLGWGGFWLIIQSMSKLTCGGSSIILLSISSLNADTIDLWLHTDLYFSPCSSKSVRKSNIHFRAHQNRSSFRSIFGYHARLCQVGVTVIQGGTCSDSTFLSNLHINANGVWWGIEMIAGQLFVKLRLDQICLDWSAWVICWELIQQPRN